MALVLRLVGRRSKWNPPSSNIVFFSTSDSSSNSPFYSLFGGNRKQSPNSDEPRFTDNIQKNLHEFRARTAAPPPAADAQISFQKLYRENIHRNLPKSTSNSSFNIESIRESLRNVKPATQPSGRSLRPTPSAGSFFGKELDASSSLSTAFLRSYSVEDLGQKLRMLRPDAKGKDWFSVKELSERMARLKKLEEEEEKKQARSNPQNNVFMDLRGTLQELNQDNIDNTNKASRQGLSILSHLTGTPSFSLDPPKPHLVEKYFHPDNMSSAEKMKIQLAKVRDEFKMSESDCGSARVQIAQLTTKIKHLSAVLHKKDVHSRKGLVAMVQRRKKLLKYLRRTDWDSYCFVISNLGLRDNPDHKIT